MSRLPDDPGVTYEEWLSRQREASRRRDRMLLAVFAVMVAAALAILSLSPSEVGR